MFNKNLHCLYLLSVLCLELCVGIAPEVNTSSGVVSGNTIRVLNTDIHQYFNIPFAEPPVGALRFARPVPLKEAREDTIDGTKWSSNGCDNTHEDCLVLNVFAPAVNQTNATLIPVMFWIYGGAFVGGSASGYDGSALAANGVVFVATNYRLGPFGFLYGGEESAPGNVGLYDQNLALKWVRDNIHLFGGDKDMITLFGESAGSISVSAHILSPLSKGLFKRAIMESGAELRYVNIDVISNKTARLDNAMDEAKKLNCTGAEWLDCLRKVDAKFIRSMNILREPLLVGTEFLPVTAQEAFKTRKYNQNIDLIAGNNQNEAGSDIRTVRLTNQDAFEKVFIAKFNGSFPAEDPTPALEFYLSTADKNSTDSLNRAYIDYSSAEYLGCTTYAFAKQFATNTPKSNTFYYQLNYNGVRVNPGCNGTTMGVCHGSDIPFVFGHPILRANSSIQLEYDFSIEIMKMWTNFAKNGKPTSDSHKWPQLLNGTQTPKVKELNALNYYRVYDDLYHYTCDGLFKNFF